jgi:hypothetical protein
MKILGSLGFFALIFCVFTQVEVQTINAVFAHKERVPFLVQIKAFKRCPML